MPHFGEIKSCLQLAPLSNGATNNSANYLQLEELNAGRNLCNSGTLHQGNSAQLEELLSRSAIQNEKNNAQGTFNQLKGLKNQGEPSTNCNSIFVGLL